MNLLLKSVTQLRGKRRSDAVAAACAIARKSVNGKASDRDARELADLLDQAGMSEADYEHAVSIVTTHARSKAAGSALPEAKKVEKAARAAIADDEARIKRQAAENEERRRALRRDLAGKARATAAAKRAVREAQALEIAHPDILAVAVVDLDMCTPTFRGYPVNVRDAGAEHVEVPHAVYVREESRRARILGRARSRAQAEYERQLDQWRASLPRDIRGMPAGSAADLARAPTFTLPTWAEIVAAGLHRTLDDAPERAA